jgi:hypothetical protein
VNAVLVVSDVIHHSRYADPTTVLVVCLGGALIVGYLQLQFWWRERKIKPPRS